MLRYKPYPIIQWSQRVPLKTTEITINTMTNPAPFADTQAALEGFSQLTDENFSLSNEGTILWKQAASAEPVSIAQLVKSDAYYAPTVALTIMEHLNQEQVKTVEERLSRWLTDTVKKTFEFLFMLEHTQISNTARGIAYRLFEEHGIIFRPRIQNMVKPLELAERQALSRLGVRIGAHYVYVKDCLKPASIRLMAILWRIANPESAEHAITPPDGNVSFAVSEKAPKRFYLTIGFPIFGDLAVRADMIERLNSAIFEKAVDGRYVFDPALASTIGASVEQTHKVLRDLGFPSHEEAVEKQPAQETEKTAEELQTEETTPTEEDTKETKTVYSLKRVKPQTDKKPKPTVKSNDKKPTDKPHKGKKQGGSKKPMNVMQDKSHGHNAFAGLDALLKQQSDKK